MAIEPIDIIGTTGPDGPARGGNRGPFVEVFLTAGGTVISTRSITDEVAGILRGNGFRPESFEVLAWPTGATRHARIRLLLAKVDYDLLQTALPDWMAPVSLTMATVTFSRMWVLDQAVVAWTEATGPVYALDVVDGRWWWSDKEIDAVPGFNVTTDDREQHYESSLDAGEPWTYETALAELFSYLSPFATGAVYSPVAAQRLMSSLGLRDLMVERLPVPNIIDRLLVLCGHVLIANIDGTYGVRAIEQGDADLDTLLEAGTTETGLTKDFLITAGPAAVASTSPTDANFKKVLESPEWIARHNPERVAVVFPTALKGGTGYSFDQGESGSGKGYVMGRWHRVASTAGQPSGLNNTETATVFDPEWAIFDSGALQNTADLNERAADVARAYFGRLSSGAGRFRFTKIVDMIYGGASLIHWSVVRYGTERGVFTDVWGEIHDPIYGHQYNRPITAVDMLSIGRVRAMPRPGGGLLLDATAGGSRRSYEARITGVNPDANGFNATYKAQAIDDESITVPKDQMLYDDQDLGNPAAWEAPATRPADAPPVNLIPLSSTGGPADMGDCAYIFVDTGPGAEPGDPDIDYHVLKAWEKLNTEPCPTPAQGFDPDEEIRLLSIVGLL